MINADVEGSEAFGLGLAWVVLGGDDTAGIFGVGGFSETEPFTPSVGVLDFFFLVIAMYLCLHTFRVRQPGNLHVSLALE